MKAAIILTPIIGALLVPLLVRETTPRKRLRRIRFLETIFLLTTASVVGSDDFFSLGIGLGFEIHSTAEFAAPSTVLIGYALAMIGSIRQSGSPNQVPWLISLGLSGLGVIAQLNEFTRYFAGYGFQLIYSANLPLLVLDWTMFAKDKPVAAMPRPS